MKKYALIFLCSLMSAMANADEQKIGYVNFEIAFAQANEAQKFTTELEAEERSILEREQKARTTIEGKLAKFQESMAKLSDKARQEQQMALNDEINKEQDALNKLRTDYTQKRQRILTDLENKIRLQVESLARKEGLDIVFNSVAMVFVSDKIKKNDLTTKLIAEFNKAYPVKAEPAKKGAPAKSPAKPAEKKAAPASK